jgi:hypothetical protein
MFTRKKHSSLLLKSVSYTKFSVALFHELFLINKCGWYDFVDLMLMDSKISVFHHFFIFHFLFFSAFRLSGLLSRL